MSDFREIEIEIFPYRFQSRKLGLSRAFEFRQLSLVFPRATAAAPTRTIRGMVGNGNGTAIRSAEFNRSRPVVTPVISVTCRARFTPPSSGFYFSLSSKIARTKLIEKNNLAATFTAIEFAKGLRDYFRPLSNTFHFSSFITCIGFRGDTFYRFRCESRYINCSIARKEKKEGKKETAYNDSF